MIEYKKIKGGFDMINRFELKMRAREVLRENYWLSVAACVLVSVITQIASSVLLPVNLLGSSMDLMSAGQSPFFMAAMSAGAMVVFLIMLLFGVAISIFFIAPLNASRIRFFIQSAKGNNNLKTMLDIFRSEHYLNVVKTLFMRDLRLIGWSLIYIIPFVVISTLSVFAEEAVYLMPVCFFALIPLIMKQYSYYMTDYIIAENPEMNYKECLELSRTMMRGCRFELFVLELSFIGWYLLGAMCFGIGVIFVTPYVSATIVQFYFDRKNTSVPCGEE